MARTIGAMRAVCMGSAAVRLHHSARRCGRSAASVSGWTGDDFPAPLRDSPPPRVRAGRGRARADAPENHTVIFCASVLAILPLAAIIGRATEVLAEQLGGGIGGLLNATFGNAAELIIGALALREGLVDLVKASLTGSIIGNVLLVFGASAFVGGLKHHDPALQPHGGRAGHDDAAAEHDWPGGAGRVPPGWRAAPEDGVELKLDTEIAVVLFVTYCASLIFTLRTHRDLYGHADGRAQPPAHTKTSSVRGR